MQYQEEVIHDLELYFGMSGMKVQDYFQKLAEKIEYLITNDFEGLLFVLYRLDVDENKVKMLISEAKGANPGAVIAKCIIDRLEQKIIWRKKFKQQQGKEDIDESERW